MTAALSADTVAAAHHKLKVRKIDFEFTDDIPEFWYAGDPFRTLLLAALSGGFPEGERFFIDSVRHFQDRITDPALKKAIRSFIGQEAHHAKQHHALNGFLSRRGYPVDSIDRGVGKLMNLFRNYMTPERQLAHTAAIEHFTAIMAEHVIMGDLDELRKMAPEMARIWAWHAVEESEHKAVAFDVYKETVDDEWVRISQMMLATFLFLTFSSIDFLRMLRRSGHMTDLKMWMNGINHYWGRPGVFRRLIPKYLRYYRRDFHPWQEDNSARVDSVKTEFLGEWA
ncbi:metal-dependent hydrolase [Mangrovitalea sediminis]|uniref:metal-dependent hydrolase n=1 Tax=Mangrovitalea sediminis TaxID=1982043 RepID=UPI000BE5E42B|nr:metal-dependent hydrolase [Mangrovitalea sediminis]